MDDTLIPRPGPRRTSEMLASDRWIPTPERVRTGLRALDPGPGDDREAPVFLLSCGWRSGSTLLQRVLMTDPRLVVWGEPLGRVSPLSRLTALVADAGDSPPPDDFTELSRLDDVEPAQDWLANLFPPGDDLRAGLRAWLERWLAAPARARGFERWGLKEVRLGAADALVLRWLYPSARFVVLVRDPFDAWRSLREVALDWDVHERYPDRPVQDAATFGRLWDRLATGWADVPEIDPVALRYESLGDCEDLGTALGLRLDPARALSARVGSTAKHGLDEDELAAIEATTVAGRAAWGYAGRRTGAVA